MSVLSIHRLQARVRSRGRSPLGAGKPFMLCVNTSSHATFSRSLAIQKVQKSTQPRKYPRSFIGSDGSDSGVSARLAVAALYTSKAGMYFTISELNIETHATHNDCDNPYTCGNNGRRRSGKVSAAVSSQVRESGAQKVCTRRSKRLICG